jgi:hypothetical protein
MDGPAPHVDGDLFWGLVRSRRRGPLVGPGKPLSGVHPARHNPRPAMELPRFRGRTVSGLGEAPTCGCASIFRRFGRFRRSD